MARNDTGENDADGTDADGTDTDETDADGTDADGTDTDGTDADETDAEGSKTRGSLTDTYVAALQHDLVELPTGMRRVGVVRKPTRWFHGVVDENRPALGPPESLLADVQDREEAFAMDGLCDEEAHNAAWDAVDFGERYRDHLETDDDAKSAVADLRTTLDDGTSVALVCYENTEQKRCHRTILRDVLEARLG